MAVVDRALDAVGLTTCTDDFVPAHRIRDGLSFFVKHFQELKDAVGDLGGRLGSVHEQMPTKQLMTILRRMLRERQQALLVKKRSVRKNGRVRSVYEYKILK